MGNLNAGAFALISKKRRSIHCFVISLSISKIYEILITFGSKKIDFFEGDNQKRRSEQNIIME